MELITDLGKQIKYRKGHCQISTLWVGIDIGSTTVKIAAIDPQSRDILFWRYLRHNASQAKSVFNLLEMLHKELPDTRISLAACGSGAEPIVERIGGVFVQEVIAISIAIKSLYPHVRTAIELGGQDAKIMVFNPDKQTGTTKLIDMRMNGSCAGGTGAFIDQMAVLLGIGIEDFNELASKGRKVHPISGRCGVFAKGDILPLINLGIPREDIALSVFHAVANQTICSLAQGIEIVSPIAFMGGPFSFNPTLIQAFQQKLHISSEQAFKPEFSQIIAAIGTALSIGELHNGNVPVYHDMCKLQEKITARNTDIVVCKYEQNVRISQTEKQKTLQFFANDTEREGFLKRHAVVPFRPFIPASGTLLEVFAGIDAGSTTLKVVLIDRSGKVLNTWYEHNSGDTIETARKALISLWKQYADNGVKLSIAGLGTTGYGENLCAQAFGADFHTVETVAHAFAALKHFPDASFVLDIGGQDMKAMKIEQGIIQEVYLNEACSSGCGSFIEATAQSLGIRVEDIAQTAFKTKDPASLGSRCTVFMLSSITTEQKNGKTREEIVAGLCRSVIENVFSKVIRISDTNKLGKKIIVQGGTFKNDAILRAFEQYVERPVYRAPFCGEMGAYGMALLTMNAMSNSMDKSRFIGFEALQNIGYSKVTQDICPHCSNHCSRDIIKFSTGITFCTGNRCEKGNVSSSTASKPSVRRATPVSLAKLREKFLLNPDTSTIRILPENGITVGIPLVFEFWNSLPFWRALYGALGFTVVVSGRSSMTMVQNGNRFAPSDSICFPAKLMHGHIESLIAKKVNRIFVPTMRTLASRNGHDTAVHLCPIIQEMPILAKELNRPFERQGCIVDAPVFAWESRKLRNIQLVDFFKTTYSIKPPVTKQAIELADQAQNHFTEQLATESRNLLKTLEQSNGIGVLMLGRPYHSDSLVNHNIPELFGALEVPVLTADTLPDLGKIDISHIRPELYNPFHTELYSAAIFAARHPNLEVVQLTSFGCGHDAITIDEVARLMAIESDKRPLVLKIDDGECKSSLTIRVRSFIETVRRKRESR
jgi:predicted CoA-substrate-specific enzyme activase